MRKGKIKFAIINVVLVCLLSLCGCASGGKAYTFDISDGYDFRGMDLGVSSDVVKATEPNTMTKETVLGDQTILTYKDVSVDGFNANILYAIDTNTDTFVSGTVYYICDEKELDAVYNSLVKKCNELYGTKYAYFDGNSVHWKVDDKYVCVLKSTTGGNKVAYNVCTEESY